MIRYTPYSQMGHYDSFLQYPGRPDKFEQMVNFLPEYQKPLEGIFHTPRSDPDDEWKQSHKKLETATVTRS